MKILILGVSGFIGKNLYNNLISEYDVYGVSKSKLNKRNCVVLNLLKKNALSNYLDNKNFDVIINLASVLASEINLNDVNLLTLNNEINMNIVNALHDRNKLYFINFSSSAVYPNISGKFNENSKLDPVRNRDCLYGLSKINGEVLFNYFLNDKHDLTHLRLGYVHGNGMNKKRIHSVFERELKTKNQITIWGNGERIIPQISIDYLVKTIKTIINKRIFGTYNLIEENSSLKNIAKKIIKNKGNSRSKILKINKGNKEKFRLDNSKIISELNK